MSHKTIARFLAASSIEEGADTDNVGIEVVALVNSKGNATSYRVYQNAKMVGDEHDTAKQAISSAASLALIQVYDECAEVTK